MGHDMIRLGIIGYGYWGPNLARNAAEANGSELGAIADFSPAALARAKKRYPSATLYNDWRDLIGDPKIDAVLVATPVASHFEIGLAALQAGKHVIIEKPMTATSAQARILIHESANRNLVLMVDHTFVYTPAVRKIHELIDKGMLGDLYYYDSTRVNLGLFQRDVNVIWDLAVHDLSILDYLMPEKPVTVTASGAGNIKGSPENIARIMLFYPSGAVANVSVNWLAPVKVRQTLIGGSKQMIVYDDLEPSEKVKVYDRGVQLTQNPDEVQSLRVSYRMGDMWAPQLLATEALLTEIEHFVDCIEHGTQPITSGANGLGVVTMLEGAVLSMRQRGMPIDLEPVRRAS
jgi:predicted dehydrogenase